MAEEYNIAKSLKVVKHLYPVLKDAHGNVIDGDHRLSVDPNWPVIFLDHIKTPTQLILARMIANTHRRMITIEERREMLNKAADSLVKEGVKKEEVVNTLNDLTTFSKQYIRNLINPTYKRDYEQKPQPANSLIRGDSSAPVIEKEPEKVVLPSAEEYLADYRARHAQPDVEYLSWSLTKNYGVPEREARAMARSRPAYVGQAAKAPAKPSKYEPPQSPTCRCPMCMRDGADKLAILANFVENTVLAQRTLFEFVTEALR